MTRILAIAEHVISDADCVGDDIDLPQDPILGDSLTSSPLPFEEPAKDEEAINPSQDGIHSSRSPS